MKAQSISFGNNAKIYPLRESQYNDKKDNTAKYTAEAGTAGFGAAAVRKSGIVTKMVNNAAQRATNVARNASKAAQFANRNAKEASGLLNSFFKNSKIFAEDIMARLIKLKDNKLLKPIIESPLTKKAAGALGGVFAFFVLITGVTEAVKNGKIAVGDIKEQFDLYREAA